MIPDLSAHDWLIIAGGAFGLAALFLLAAMIAGAFDDNRMDL